MPALLQVALGGALGAMLRFLTVQYSMRFFGAGFPYGTMIVNVLGSFVMGLFAVYLIERLGAVRLAPFVLTGVLGGFTTFSAFSLDLIYLIEKMRLGAAVIYLAGSVGLSIMAVLMGVLMMRSVLS